MGAVPDADPAPRVLVAVVSFYRVVRARPADVDAVVAPGAVIPGDQAVVVVDDLDAGNVFVRRPADREALDLDAVRVHIEDRQCRRCGGHGDRSSAVLRVDDELPVYVHVLRVGPVADDDLIACSGCGYRCLDGGIAETGVGVEDREECCLAHRDVVRLHLAGAAAGVGHCQVHRVGAGRIKDMARALVDGIHRAVVLEVPGPVGDAVAGRLIGELDRQRGGAGGYIGGEGGGWGRCAPSKYHPIIPCPNKRLVIGTKAVGEDVRGINDPIAICVFTRITRPEVTRVPGILGSVVDVGNRFGGVPVDGIRHGAARIKNDT
ncbi:hypothetical protein ASZ90_016455 [hydrocarbon metagenome]|uniref:Uncharacterized protein n=1 Tax=hydrocarbon metagenome TaxID=938273 RepID=A0A0W8EUH7_9ZZZZ